MATTVNQQETKKAAAKTVGQAMEVTGEDTPKAPNPFDEVQVRARMAYRSYREAQSDVANAYRERDRQDQEAFKEVEREAYKNYGKAIEKALRAREKAEQDADEGCKRVKEKASQVYEEAIKQALTACKGTIDEGWKVSRETSEQMWTLFQTDNTV